jgi:hypothetical protein
VLRRGARSPASAWFSKRGEGVGVYGHAAYGAEELLERLDNAAIHNGLKVQPRAAVKGHFSKDRLDIDLDKQTVT